MNMSDRNDLKKGMAKAIEVILNHSLVIKGYSDHGHIWISNFSKKEAAERIAAYCEKILKMETETMWDGRAYTQQERPDQFPPKTTRQEKKYIIFYWVQDAYIEETRKIFKSRDEAEKYGKENFDTTLITALPYELPADEEGLYLLLKQFENGY